MPWVSQYSASGLACFCPAWPVLVCQTCVSEGASGPDYLMRSSPMYYLGLPIKLILQEVPPTPIGL